MKCRSGSILVLVGLAGVLLAPPMLGHAQYGQGPGGVLMQNQRQELGIDLVFAKKRLRAMNDERHKALVSDTEKLLKLARQLDAEIASNPTDKMTPEEIHKAAEIEKLAKSVKEKMAQSFTGGPQIQMPVSPLGRPGDD